MSIVYKKSQRTSNNRISCHHVVNLYYPREVCCILPSHDVVTFSCILLSYYCHWTILIVTLLSHYILTLCLSRLSYALLTLCHIRLTHAILTLWRTQLSNAILTQCHTLRSQAIITLCHTLLSHDVLTLCCTLLSHAILTLCFNLLSHAVLTLCHMLLSNAVLTLCRTRLIDFFGINNIIILFAHKETHKLTWISPNQRDKKQIYHLLISGKWRKSLQDVRFRKGADVGSDHHLVVKHIKLKLKRTVTPIRLLKWGSMSPS